MEVVQILSLISPFVTSVVIAATFIYQMRASHRQKMLDVVSDFNKRFNDIRYVMLPKVGKEVPVEAYCHRFWNPQVDQYHAWQLGFVPNSYFTYWLQERHLEANENQSVDGVPFQEGWEKAKLVLRDKEFAGFMEVVINDSVEAAMRRYPPRKRL